MNSYEAILARLRQNVAGDFATMEGSFAGDILSAAATELARIYSQELDTVTERAFVGTAQGDWLDAACADYGVTRKQDESDQALRLRTLNKIQLQASSGNEAHYKAWAEEIPGVLAAQAKGLARGPGTVDVYLAADPNQATQALLDTVWAHIETLRPVCVNTRVAFAQPTTLDIEADLVLSPSATLESVAAQFEPTLAAYLDRVALAEQGSLISLTRIAGLLMDCVGVLDAKNLTLNGVAASLSVPNGHFAVAGTCRFNPAVNP